MGGGGGCVSADVRKGRVSAQVRMKGCVFKSVEGHGDSEGKAVEAASQAVEAPGFCEDQRLICGQGEPELCLSSTHVACPALKSLLRMNTKASSRSAASPAAPGS